MRGFKHLFRGEIGPADDPACLRIGEPLVGATYYGSIEAGARSSICAGPFDFPRARSG